MVRWRGVRRSGWSRDRRCGVAGGLRSSGTFLARASFHAATSGPVVRARLRIQAYVRRPAPTLALATNRCHAPWTAPDSRTHWQACGTTVIDDRRSATGALCCTPIGQWSRCNSNWYAAAVRIAPLRRVGSGVWASLLVASEVPMPAASMEIPSASARD